MKTSTWLMLLTLVSCSYLLPQEVNAQYIYGRSTVRYDAATNMITTSSSTQIDFLAQEFYQGYVNS